ncbi:hypothetical protein BABINDRAFT_161158 [Babjeviella inositovora NRRL Y-12698]|uniref:Uncharacterized protein n=1 Tax=Babjeviella inositovora NRRL Y-12698 TaxID=984486 RepID=A0A1E3QT40_9ASCO|nr:uncharacterized protein BABINDRAFT_161158 [Babjeviella inositovora NRRL Y-12698]ODQ80182.1 hypothetical protein BABINDRAFT_161158 [Babjeviella inositovora NRRL Y-12698]
MTSLEEPFFPAQLVQERYRRNRTKHLRECSVTEGPVLAELDSALASGQNTPRYVYADANLHQSSTNLRKRGRGSVPDEHGFYSASTSPTNETPSIPPRPGLPEKAGSPKRSYTQSALNTTYLIGSYFPEIFAIRLNPLDKVRDLKHVYRDVFSTGSELSVSEEHPYDEQLDQILANLDASAKKLLLEKLLKEREPQTPLDAEYNGGPIQLHSLGVQYPDNIELLPPIKRIEILIIKLIQLGFVLLHVFIPILHKMYLKFVNNQFFIMNLKNLNRLLNWAIAWLLYVDEAFLTKNQENTAAEFASPEPEAHDDASVVVYSPQELEKLDEFNRLISKNLSDLEERDRKSQLPTKSAASAITQSLRLKAMSYVSDKIVESILYPPERPSSSSRPRSVANNPQMYAATSSAGSSRPSSRAFDSSNSGSDSTSPNKFKDDPSFGNVVENFVRSMQ